jgi:hypothetical protein
MKSGRRFVFLLVSLLACAGPAAFANEDNSNANYGGLMAPLGYIVLYYNSKGPLSYVTSTLKDLPHDAVQLGRVSGVSCQYGVAIPITPPTSPTSSGTSISGAQGNGSYEKTLSTIKQAHPEVAGLYDVIVDLHTTSVLGIFKRVCTEVSARAFALPK